MPASWIHRRRWERVEISRVPVVAQGPDTQTFKDPTGRTPSQVRLVWEAAYATSYRVEISRDGATGSALRNVTGGTGGTVRVDASSALARHVRVVGIQRATGYGYSLWEIEVR